MCEMTDSTNSLDPLIDVHGDLDDLMLQHQTALLDQDIARARDAFEEFSRTIRKHIEIEDRMLLPVYQSRAGEPEGGATELFTSEWKSTSGSSRMSWPLLSGSPSCPRPGSSG